MLLLILRNLVKEKVLPLRRNFVKELLPLRRKFVKEGECVLRQRIYRKKIFLSVAQGAGLEFSRADVVVSISRGPLGQWFPETEH